MSSDFGLPAGSDPLERCAHHRGADIDVVLLHYAVEGWAPNLGSEPCLPLASLEKLDTDAICVGHLHLPNQMRLRSGALLMNPGATEHISFGEEALDCGFWVLSLSPGRAEAKYVALPTQPMRTISLNVPEIHDEQSDPLTDQILRRIEQASHPDRLLRVRLSGRLLREGFHELDLPRLQAGAAALNFHCQVETEELTLVDEWSEVPLGYGVSFDVRQELQDTLSAFVQSHQNDPETLEICRLAGDRLLTRYSELTGGSR